MKSQIRLALMMLASAAAVPVLAQDAPQCASNFDSGRNYFTVKNPAPGAINQQCFLTVMPASGTSASFPNLAQYPGPQLMEGTYEIELSGGGGGGGGGSFLNSGGGGAGAVPAKMTRYLSPGVYRLTIGTGGEAGGGTGGSKADAQRGGDGNPTSISNAYTQETIAGFPGAEVYAGRARQNWTVASARGNTMGGMGADTGGDGTGGDGIAGQSDGGSGAKLDEKGRVIKGAQDGGRLEVAGYNAPGGRAGGTAGGGGGGAGYEKGGDGVPAGQGTTGARGGDGFIALRPVQLAQAPVAPMADPVPAVVPVVPAPAPEPVVKPRKDRG